MGNCAKNSPEHSTDYSYLTQHEGISNTKLSQSSAVVLPPLKRIPLAQTGLRPFDPIELSFNSSSANYSHIFRLKYIGKETIDSKYKYQPIEANDIVFNNNKKAKIDINPVGKYITTIADGKRTIINQIFIGEDKDKNPSLFFKIPQVYGLSKKKAPLVKVLNLNRSFSSAENLSKKKLEEKTRELTEPNLDINENDEKTRVLVRDVFPEEKRMKFVEEIKEQEKPVPKVTEKLRAKPPRKNVVTEQPKSNAMNIDEGVNEDISLYGDLL